MVGESNPCRCTYGDEKIGVIVQYPLLPRYIGKGVQGDHGPIESDKKSHRLTESVTVEGKEPPYGIAFSELW
jgi:hypothetical protein